MKRYTFVCDYGDGCGLHQSQNGNYVLYPDAANLERRLAAVLRIMKDETEALCCCEINDGVCTWQCTHCEAYERARTVARGE